MAYTHSGSVKFIFEDETKAIVEETVYGDSAADRYTVVNEDFSAKSIGDTVTYNYDADSNSNDGRDVTYAS